MLKVLLPVDGSASSTRATETLVDMLGWCKSSPQIDLLAVHLPVPRGMTALSNMVLRSVATRVLHLARTPVVLIH